MQGRHGREEAEAGMERIIWPVARWVFAQVLCIWAFRRVAPCDVIASPGGRPG